MTNVISEQRFCHAELHIGLEILVVVYIDLGNVRLEARFINQKVDMRRPHVMAALCTGRIADWTVDRNRISRRLNAAKTDEPLLVGGELAAQVHVRLSRVL